MEVFQIVDKLYFLFYKKGKWYYNNKKATRECSFLYFTKFGMANSIKIVDNIANYGKMDVCA